jgi:hypothetical protein
MKTKINDPIGISAGPMSSDRMTLQLYYTNGLGKGSTVCSKTGLREKFPPSLEIFP